MPLVARFASAAFLALFLIVPASMAQPVEPWMDKLDPAARMLLSAEVQGRGLAAEVALLEQLDVSVAADGTLHGAFFVRLSDPGQVAALEAAGFHLQTLAGDVAVGWAPVRQLGPIAAVGAVESVSVGRFVELLNDRGNQDINTLLVHAGTGLPQAYRGEGVIVGVLDTGIDVTHLDFKEEYSTRIEYLLEYLPDPATPPTAFAEWSREEIEADLWDFPQRDIHGHGTHVAGTAAGSGRASETFTGVAPAARLVVVKGTRMGVDPALRQLGFREVDIVNGTAWIFDRAAELGMPAVVNLSLGSPGGPLDGSDNAIRAISNLAGEGRIIVFAGGNNGSHVIHAGADYGPGATPTVLVRPLASDGFEHQTFGQFIQVQGWYDAGTLSTVTIAARDLSTHVTVAEVTIPVGESLADLTPIHVGGELAGYVWIDAETTQHPLNQDGVFNAYVFQRLDQEEDNDVDLRQHIWSVTATAVAEGRLDTWLVRTDMGRFVQATDGVPDFIPGDTWMTLNRWAAGERIISAAAYTTRPQWLNDAGQTVGVPGVVGTRASFSSQGPTRDGRIRPDVAAPGSIIGSARSESATFDPLVTIHEHPVYIMMQGTSMSAPFLSGAVALMLQVDPTLDPERTREILHRTARADEHTGAVPNAAYGYGKLDVFAAVQAVVLAVSDEDGPAASGGLTLEAPYPNPARNSVHLVYNLPRATHATVTVYDLLGREVVRVVEGEAPAGPHHATLDARRLAAGTYVAVLRADGERQSRPFVVVR